MDVHRLPGSPSEQRYTYVKKMLSQPQAAAPGEKYIYANSGYTVAAVMAERATGKAWEDLMRELIFTPLGMKSADFGAMGTPGKIDQPWQHRVVGRGEATPIEPGPYADNPPAIGPGGTVHCTLADWAKFVQAHLAGARGKETLVGPSSFRMLHRPPLGGEYAMGWIVTPRDWGGGNVLTHAGSNNQNYAVVWLAPAKNFAVLAVTNQGGDAAQQACDDVAGAMIQRYLIGR
jgi:CubicO group peptidase (beta-lactamase class C family)